MFRLKLLIFILISLFISATPVLAVPKISVTLGDLPSSINALDTFTIPFTILNNDVGSSFHYKVVDFNNYNDFTNTPDDKCNDYYVNCQTISVGSSETSSLAISVKSVGTTGPLRLKIRVALDPNHDTTDSDVKTLTVNQPIPTQIAPSPIPSDTPVSTAVPTPTSANTPVPTLSIKINSLPSSVIAGQDFNVSFTVGNITPNQEYYFKVFGGSNSNYGIETQNNNGYYGFTSAWENFPKFSSTTNSLSQTLIVRVKQSESAGQYQLKLKIRQVDGSFDKESDAQTITVTAAAPVSTPVLVATSTTAKKLSPTLPLIFTPNSELTPTETEVPTIIDNPTFTDQTILGATDVNLAPTGAVVASETSSSHFLPVLLIISGGLLLLTPIAVSQFKKR